MNAPVSLQTFLTRLIWLCVVPLLLLASWLAQDSVRNSRTNRDAEATHLVQNFATAIDQYLDARIGALGMLAASPLASSAARRAEFYQEAQGFAQHFGSHVLLADPALQMLFNTRVPLGTTLPLLPPSKGRAAAPQALKTGAPAVGDVVLGPIAGVPLVAIAVPGTRNGKTEFLLLTTLEVRQFQDRLAQLALPSGWSLTLRDGTGATIASRAPAGFDASRDVDSTGRFVVPSARAPWSVLLEIPRQSYQTPLFMAAALLALLILGATVIGVVAGRLASRRLSQALAALTSPTAPDAAPPAIAEIAAVRDVLDTTAQQRASAEAALQHSERRFRLAASTGNVWDWNVSSGAVCFPAEFWRGLGYAQAQIDEPTAVFESLLHPQDLPRWRQSLQDHIDHHLPLKLDYRIREQSGDYRWFNTRGQAQWEGGRATYMAGTTFDISARKLAEQKVRDQIELLTRSEAESRELLATSTQARRALLGVLEDQVRAEAALGQSRARLEALTRRLLEVQEAERRMIARELHDEVGGVLTAVKLNLQALRRAHSDAQREAALADGLELVEGAIGSVRSLSLELRPAMLDDLGLIPALKWYCERQAQRAGVTIELALDAIDLKAAAQLETACFRIVQEALTNAVRHAQARRIAVALRRGDGHFVLEISDDGVGFDAQAARARGLAGESGGLLGMAERVGLLGGRFGIQTTPGGGTRVWADFAIPEGGFF